MDVLEYLMTQNSEQLLYYEIARRCEKHTRNEDLLA